MTTLAPACALESGGLTFRWPSQAEHPDSRALSIVEEREGIDKLRRAICAGNQSPVCSSSTFSFQGIFSSCPEVECHTTPPPFTAQPLSHSAEPGQCFCSLQGAVCFVSPTICSICFVSANLWSTQGANSFRGCRSAGTEALPGKPMQDRNQEGFSPFCSQDFSGKVRACCLVLAFTAPCFAAWALSEGAVGRWKRRGKSCWSIFTFLPTEGFESLSSSAVSGNGVFVDEGCVCTVKMALWMLCRVQPMVLHMAHFPEDAH